MTRYADWGESEVLVPQRPSPFRLKDFVQTVAARKKFIVWSTTAVTLLSVVAAALLRDNYHSTAVIMPPRQDESVSALLSGQGGLVSSLGAGAIGGIGLNLKNPNEIYTSMLASRTLTTELVNRFHLEQYYHKKRMSDAVKALLRHTTIELGKDNLIRITVSTHDPNFSCQLANAYVDRLHEMNTSVALTDAAQRRLFYEQQLDHEKDLLAQAETALEETQSKTGILQPAGQASMIAENVAALRAQITEREATLDSLRTSVTEENPQYIALEAQIISLQKRLAELESSEKAPAPGDIEVPTAQLPKASLEYLRKFRDVEQHEQLYALLLKQLEAAKIDEAKSAPVIQVIDPAIPADRIAWPSRWLLVPATLIAALFINILLCIVLYIYNTLRRVQASGLQQT